MMRLTGFLLAMIVLAGCVSTSNSSLPASSGVAGSAQTPAAKRGKINLYSDTLGDAVVEGITAGPDGAIWFTDSGNGVVGRITTHGKITLQTAVSAGVSNGITTGPDGALWFTSGGNPAHIGRITTAGDLTLFDDPGGSYPHGITNGPDGALWFAESNGSVGRITTSGDVKHFQVAPADATLQGIAAGPDGALWVTQNVIHFSQLSNQVIRVTTRGKKKSYTVGLGPDFICLGSDGAMWFTEEGSQAIGRLTTGGAYTDFSLNDRYAVPTGITAGPDGALWFADDGGPTAIGRMTTSGKLKTFPIPGDPGVEQVTSGPDGRMWFTSPNPPLIGRITI
jgi:virginiamycin B lyase